MSDKQLVVVLVQSRAMGQWSQYRNAVASGLLTIWALYCERDPTLPRYGTDSIDTGDQIRVQQPMKQMFAALPAYR
jgi:hypothetical protein